MKIYNKNKKEINERRLVLKKKKKAYKKTKKKGLKKNVLKNKT